MNRMTQEELDDLQTEIASLQAKIDNAEVVYPNLYLGDVYQSRDEIYAVVVLHCTLTKVSYQRVWTVGTPGCTLQTDVDLAVFFEFYHIRIGGGYE